MATHLRRCIAKSAKDVELRLRLVLIPKECCKWEPGDRLRLQSVLGSNFPTALLTAFERQLLTITSAYLLIIQKAAKGWTLSQLGYNSDKSLEFVGYLLHQATAMAYSALPAWPLLLFGVLEPSALWVSIYVFSITLS